MPESRDGNPSDSDRSNGFRIHVLCEQYEKKWSEEQEGLVEDFLQQAQDVDQNELLYELLKIDLFLRCENGTAPVLIDYLNRFEDQNEAVVAAFQWVSVEFPSLVEAPLNPENDVNLCTPNRFSELALLAIGQARKLKLVTALQLDRAISRWADTPSQDLFSILVDQGSLSLEDVDTLHAVAARIAARHSRSPGNRSAPAGAESDSTEPIQLPLSGRRFSILKLIEEGGQGRVSIAIDLECNRKVAFKELRLDKADEEVYQGQFLLEAEVTARLEHPGIVPVYSLGQHSDGRPFYAMKYIRGESLLQAINRHHQSSWSDTGAERVSLRHLLGRFIDVCRAVEYAHSRGILHRDLKPANIVLGKFGETLVVDWGLASSYPNLSGRKSDSPGDQSLDTPIVPSNQSSTGNLQPGKPFGTPKYMSPEQAEGRASELTAATDIYSLGATLYHIVVGKPPFQGDKLAVIEQVKKGELTHPREHLSTIPLAIERICLRAMELRPLDRFGSVEELCRLVQEWLDNEPISALYATVEYFEALVEEEPKRVEYKQRLARESLSLASCLQSMNRLDEADRLNTKAIELCLELTCNTPDDHTNLRDLILARSQLSTLCRLKGESDRAEELDTENRNLFEDLAKKATTEQAREDFASLSLHHGMLPEQADELLGENTGDMGELTDHGSVAASERSDELVENDESTLVPHSRPPIIPMQESHTPFGPSDTIHPGPEVPYFEYDPSVNDHWGGEAHERYEILELLGSGSLSNVFLGLDRNTNSLVAIKRAKLEHQDLPHRPGALGALRGEAILLSHLRHPGIVKVINIDRIPKTGEDFLVMEYVDGASLQQTLRTDKEMAIPLETMWRERVLVVAQIARALQHAHDRGVLHLDPKPHNILTPMNHTAVLIDWSLANVNDQDLWFGHLPRMGKSRHRKEMLPSFEPGQIVGSPAYMAPEQLKGGRLSPRTDVYLLGGTLFSALTGELPRPVKSVKKIFESIDQPIRDPRVLCRGLDSGLAEIVNRALAISPIDRYPTTDMMARELEAWLEA